MTQDFVMGQLRMALMAIVAFAGGKGWLTPTDSGLVIAFITAIGPIFAPWIWSFVVNINTKRAPQNAVVIDPVLTAANAEKKTATVQTFEGPITGKIVSVLLVAFVASAFLATGQAQAQTPRLTGNIAKDIAAATGKPNAPLLTGNIEKDMQALWQKIVSSSLTDLNYAAAMAASANTTTSTVRLQCIKAIITLNEQASGVNLKNPDGTPMIKPDPHLFTDVESLAEIIDNLSPQGPLFVNCAGAAQLAKTNVLSFVNAVVTGAAGFAAMPIIPGL